MRYRWPGNVRELQNVVEQALWLAEDSRRRTGRPAGGHSQHRGH